MSTPLQRAAYVRLHNAHPEIDAYVGEFPGRVEGTGNAVVEIYDVGPFASPPTNGSYRTLHLNVLADRERDVDGLPLRDADYLAWDIYEAVNPLLHDLDHSWRFDAPFIHRSIRADGPSLTLIPNGDGAVMLTVRYEVLMD